MGIADDKIIKGFVKVLTELIEGFNIITSKADGLSGSILRLSAVFGGLRLANAGVKGLVKYFVGLKDISTGDKKSKGFIDGLTDGLNSFSNKTNKKFGDKGLFSTISIDLDKVK
jgi:hypothetical protein